MNLPDPKACVDVLKTVVSAGAPPAAASEQPIVGARGSDPCFWIQLYDAKGRARKRDTRALQPPAPAV